MDPQLQETVVIFAVIKNDLNDGPQHPDGWTDRRTDSHTNVEHY